MTAEQILMRQEIRQMLNEVGINRNTLKDMAKEVLAEELEKACKQAIQEYNVDERLYKATDRLIETKIEKMMKSVIQERFRDVFYGIKFSVDITDKRGNSSVANEVNL